MRLVEEQHYEVDFRTAFADPLANDQRQDRRGSLAPSKTVFRYTALCSRSSYLDTPLWTSPSSRKEHCRLRRSPIYRKPFATGSEPGALLRALTPTQRHYMDLELQFNSTFPHRFG